MRLLPKSIANRTTVVLIAGLLLVMVLSAAIAHLVAQGNHDLPNRWQFIERVHVVTQVLSKIPTSQREALAQQLSDENMRVQWFNASASPEH
ncbi:MAG: hypothetical protein PVH98_11040, partial [Gammaproteobacteria bacterium]